MKRFIITFLSLLLLAFIIPAPAQIIAEVNPIVVVIGIAALAVIVSILPAPQTHEIPCYTAGVNVELWVRYILNKFWKQNKFLQYAFNDDQYVVGGSIIHIPQPGANPTVVKNRTSYPATAVQRTDTDITFALDVYTTDPTHITHAEKVELSYDKMDSVLGDHTNTLNQTVADDTIIKWLTSLPAGNIIKTSGGDAAATISGQTGTRKVMIHQDLKAARLKMNLQNVPIDGRYALLEANMQDQLLTSLSDSQYRDFSQYADAETGVIGKLYGFEIMDRSSAAIFTASDVVSPLGASVAATDNAASLCWQKDAVTRAIGEVKVFSNPDRAEYYGDIISGLLRAAARRRRTGSEGILAILGDA